MKKNLLVLVTLVFSLGQIWADELTVAFKDGNATFTGVEKEIVVTKGETTLDADDYLWEAQDAEGNEIDFINAGTYKIVVEGKNTYSEDQGEEDLTITKADISEAIFEDIADQTYKGSAYTSDDITLEAELDGYDLIESDFTITGFKNATNVGKATVNISGAGNFTGITTVNFNINPLSIAGLTFKIEPDVVVYNGEPQAANIELEDIGSYPGIILDDLKVLYDDGDIPTDAQTDPYKVTLKAKDNKNFEGVTNAKVNYTINPAPIDNATFTLEKTSADYNGNNHTLEIKTVTLEGITGTIDPEGFTVLVDGQESPSPKGVKENGYPITIKAKDDNTNFTGTNTTAVVYTVNPLSIADEDITVDPIAGKEYDEGNAIIPEPTLNFNSAGLIKDTDYSISSYTGNTEAGIATVTVAGKGNFGGTRDIPFNITKLLSHKDIEITIPAHVYAGTPITAEMIENKGIIVVDNGKTLRPGEDYKLTVGDVTGGSKIGEKSEAEITLNFGTAGIYTGSVSKNVEFNVVAAPVYNTIKINVAEGIDVLTYNSGSYTVESDGYLHLQFRTEAANGEIVLQIDGKEINYNKNPTGYSSYILRVEEKDHDVQLYLKSVEVKFPTYEGVTFEGEGVAEYGKPYTFRLTLADDIDPTNLKIYVNDVLVEPDPLRATTYTVTIDKVTGPISIRLEGITTGIEQITQGRIYSLNGALVIETITSQMVQVYTMTGKQLFAGTVNGQQTINLSKGIYIVRVGKETQKIVVN